uniref:Uncharacterized protein n=1 Tax=Chenopodium quinoa TaxID=63459 RepID=A0A803NBS4_CHEQI
MVKKKITKKAVDVEEGGSIGGYRYKKPTKGKGKPKEPAKPKPVPKKTQIAPEKSKAVSKKAGKIPESDKPESEKAKIVPKKAKIVPKKANTLHVYHRTGKEFVVTRNDICDVFCLPLSDICVPELNKNSEDESVDKRIIQAWRSDYGLSGEKESSTLPLIQHWTDVKIKKRIKLEIKAGGYGQGPLDITYPVSQLNFRGTVFKPAPTLGYDKGPSTSGTTGRIVAFELPEGIMTDEEIKKISTDVVHETFLLFKRNMDVLLFVQSTGFQTLNDLITSRRSVSLSSDDFVSVSQTELLLSDPHYLKILDGLIDECNKMKSVHDMFRGFYETYIR